MYLRNWIKWEYIIGLISIIVLYIYLDYSILVFFLFLLVPDLSMIGYFVNPKIGAILYNSVHHFSLPIILLSICILYHQEAILPYAMIWIAHILMDRTFGFGLKYANDFKETHLQKIV
ncbi:MAG: DUF4260 domain-containing protein [Solibacillus sp.]|uniref:DUF4260 domain-containing protein n=1 Tax=unclassified Solibacillus TaxID=2637870 RepID=UPI0030F71BFC